MVARSASFCACWRSITASLALLLGALVDQELTLAIAIRARAALQAGRKRQAAPSAAPRAIARRRVRRHQIALQVVRVGVSHCRIQLDQDVARLDRLPIANVDCAHHAGFERLDHLGAPGWHDLSRRGSDDIDSAEKRPRQREAEQSDEAECDRASGRRRRRFDDFERRRQEGEFVLAALRRASFGTR